MRVPLLLSTLVLAGLALLTARPAAATPRWGPPLLCHPFVIGEAESLPWGAGAFAVPDDLTPDRAAVIALEVLAEGDDLIVHLETLRRGAIALLYGRSEEPLAMERAQRFLTVLRGRAEHLGLLAELERGRGVAAARAAHGRALIHLAVAHEALANLGLHAESERQLARWLDAGLAGLPGDADAQLAATLLGVSWNDDKRWRVHARKALDASAEDPHLAANLVATLGPCLSATDLDTLAVKVLDRG